MAKHFEQVLNVSPMLACFELATHFDTRCLIVYSCAAVRHGWKYTRLALKLLRHGLGALLTLLRICDGILSWSEFGACFQHH